MAAIETTMTKIVSLAVPRSSKSKRFVVVSIDKNIWSNQKHVAEPIAFAAVDLTRSLIETVLSIVRLILACTGKRRM
jgi:hypothetical protein